MYFSQESSFMTEYTGEEVQFITSPPLFKVTFHSWEKAFQDWLEPSGTPKPAYSGKGFCWKPTATPRKEGLPISGQEERSRLHNCGWQLWLDASRSILPSAVTEAFLAAGGYPLLEPQQVAEGSWGFGSRPATGSVMYWDWQDWMAQLLPRRTHTGICWNFFRMPSSLLLQCQKQDLAVGGEQAPQVSVSSPKNWFKPRVDKLS